MNGTQDRTMIPAKLHYIWLGGKPLPVAMQGWISGWRTVMPEFEVVEWNEGNLDMAHHPWMEQMYRQGHYAFASDYARLMVLHEHGGIYLDTDVELKKSLVPFLQERCFWSFEFDNFLSTCIIGSVPGHPLLKALMTTYDTQAEPVVNNALVTDHFIHQFPEFTLDNRDQMVGGDIRIMPKECFIMPGFDRRLNFSVHHANNHWNAAKHRGPHLGRMLRTMIGDVLFFKLVNLRMGMNDTFRATQRRVHDQRKVTRAS